MSKLDRFLQRHGTIVKIVMIAIVILFVLAFFYMVWKFNGTELLIKTN